MQEATNHEIKKALITVYNDSFIRYMKVTVHTNFHHRILVTKTSRDLLYDTLMHSRSVPEGALAGEL